MPLRYEMSLAPFWWILEIIPVKHEKQNDDNTWERGYVCNMGQGRKIRKQKKNIVKVHRSVKMRMEAHYHDGTKYQPKASFEKAIAAGNLVWAD